jgi:hypothetical protein
MPAGECLFRTAMDRWARRLLICRMLILAAKKPDALRWNRAHRTSVLQAEAGRPPHSHSPQCKHCQGAAVGAGGARAGVGGGQDNARMDEVLQLLAELKESHHKLGTELNEVRGHMLGLGLGKARPPVRSQGGGQAEGQAQAQAQAEAARARREHGAGGGGVALAPVPSQSAASSKALLEPLRLREGTPLPPALPSPSQLPQHGGPRESERESERERERGAGVREGAGAAGAQKEKLGAGKCEAPPPGGDGARSPASPPPNLEEGTISL